MCCIEMFTGEKFPIFLFTVLIHIRTSPHALRVDDNTSLDKSHIPGHPDRPLHRLTHEDTLNHKDYHIHHLLEPNHRPVKNNSSSLSTVLRTSFPDKQSIINVDVLPSPAKNGKSDDKLWNFLIKNTGLIKSVVKSGNQISKVKLESTLAQTQMRKKSRKGYRTFSSKAKTIRHRRTLPDTSSREGEKRRKEIIITPEMLKRLGQELSRQGKYLYNYHGIQDRFDISNTKPPVIDKSYQEGLEDDRNIRENVLPTSLISPSRRWNNQANSTVPEEDPKEDHFSKENINTLKGLKSSEHLRNGSNVSDSIQVFERNHNSSHQPQRIVKGELVIDGEKILGSNPNSLNVKPSSEFPAASVAYSVESQSNKNRTNLFDNSRLKRLQRLVTIISDSNFAENPSIDDKVIDLNREPIIPRSIQSDSFSKEYQQADTTDSHHLPGNDDFKTQRDDSKEKQTTSTVVDRSLRSGFYKPLRLYTANPYQPGFVSPAGGRNQRLGYDRQRKQWRYKNALKRGSRRRCNFRRITVEMLVEYILTKKLCGSSVVRIRFGLGR